MESDAASWMSASQSTITLVNPSTEPTTYVFTPNSMLASTVTRLGSGALYSVSTSAMDVTTIKDVRPGMGGSVLAKINRRPLLGDAVAFAGQNGGKPKEVKISKWMKEAKVDGERRYTLETEAGFKVVLQDDAEYRLALFAADDLTALPPLAIVISARVPTDFHLQILVAFMYLEQKMRSQEKMGMAPRQVRINMPPGLVKRDSDAAKLEMEEGASEAK
ncbi:hypothetical protein HMN09_00810200 [Mycena chlorophos]|uniref:DUF6593 domain-containing protein n=1 Tax=Mycena chlorophos TaxID=658473 RepID=A0A8H6ST14_MYCCL|nr:hypothetical protein HMN09_00810200 [Mycena chlorophos]